MNGFGLLPTEACGLRTPERMRQSQRGILPALSRATVTIRCDGRREPHLADAAGGVPFCPNVCFA